MGQNNLRTQSLDLLRFPLAVIVVTVHVFNSGGMAFGGEQFDPASSPMFMSVSRFIDAFLRGISVPIYFFISGYVFFVNVDDFTPAVWLKKLKNRTKTLLIPYLIWITLELVLILVRSLPAFSDFVAYPDTRVNLDFKTILSCYWVYHGGLLVGPGEPDYAGSPYPLVIPLWFLRDLMTVVLTTPLLYWMLKRAKWWPLLIMGVCLILPLNWRFNLLANAFFFFSWGAYMSINRKDIFTSFSPYFKWTLILYPLLGIAHMCLHDNVELVKIIKLANVFVALLLAYNLAAWLLKKSYVSVSPFLASASFFIYVSHALICNRMVKIFFMILRPDTDLEIIFTYIGAEVFIVISLLGAFWLLRRYFPGLLKVVAGRK